MKRLLPLVICFFLLPVFFVSAQEGDEGMTPNEPENAGAETAGDSENSTEDSTAETGAAPEEKDPALSYIEMDIRTSSLVELAAWCRELGLSEGGSREDLASRLRSHYKLPPRDRESSTEQRTITIESARTTEYFTIEVVDEEYARLKGDVIISLKDGNATHRIKAWEILYNRTRNVITASGHVEYVKEDGGTTETFKGESITVNLDNWSSIFMDGASTKSGSSNVTAYRFAGTVISRNSEEVTVLSGADITNPNNEEALWSLHASKLWLLPGNDWAILNAVLRVGNIPVLYIPFFFYPADEIVFHPVLGHRTREGTFLQTTTYILGRPTASTTSENSITKIFGSDANDMEKKIEGVFLRSTGAKRQDPNDIRLKVIFDAYVNLGTFLATELDLPKKGIFGATKFFAGLGLTRDIYQMGGDHTPFANLDGESDWNRSMLFSLDAPFRYRFNFSVPIDIKNGSLKLEFPYYSDPYVDRDFMDRSEVLDWLTMLREGATASEDETKRNASLTSYEWRLSGSFRFPVTSLNPFVSSLSISSYSSSLLFNVRDSTKYMNPSLNTNILPNPSTPSNPGKAFFFPSRFTMYSISAGVAGTPYDSGSTAKGTQAGKGTAAGNAGAAPGDALLPDLPVSPWEPPEETADEEQTDQSSTDSGSSSSGSMYRGFGEGPGGGSFFPQDLYTLTLPTLSQKFELPSTSWGPRFSFDYRLDPSTASELQFRTANWKEQEDIDWSDVSSILSRFTSTGNLGFNINHASGSAYTNSFRLTGRGSWQDYMLLNEEAEEFNTDAKIKTARDRAYRETYFTSSWEMNTTLRPFYQNTIWGGTNFQYRLGGLLAKTEVDTTGEDPEWEWVFPKWEKEDITNHEVSTNFEAKVMDYAQNLNLSAVLPPKDALVSGNATARAWITETSVSTSVAEPFDEDLRKFNPVTMTENLKFGTVGTFQQRVIYDPEKEKYTNFNSTLNLTKIGLTASFLATYARHSIFNPKFDGISSEPLWITDPDESLQPKEFRLGYNKKFTKADLWGKRLSFSTTVTTNLNFDLREYTRSNMDFSFGFSTLIANFMNLTFSTNSGNSVLYRYFENTSLFDLPVEVYKGQEKNFFVDLANSFRFDDKELRTQSGFKLKSLGVSMLHYLGDWTAELKVTMTPYRPTGSQNYQFRNDISFLVQWIPIGEIKTDISYKEDFLSIK